MDDRADPTPGQGCCMPARPTQAAPAERVLAPSDGGAGAERVFFPAQRSFVGTDAPVIKPDGEGPARGVKLSAFALETTPVTNARFARFVDASGYRTEAEIFGWSPVFRGLFDPAALPPPSASGTPWWVKCDGAYWAAPEGPGSGIAGREDHPVAHISWADARAFAAWCGGRLPTEAEWELAARGGLADPRFPWGDAEPDDETIFCNIWQGRFPDRNTRADGYLGTSPVTAFPPNGAGLFDMAGNVWEWTSDAFRVRSVSRAAKARNAQAGADRLKVLKGGSFLCHKSYCYRYRIAARSSLPPDSSASNTGFRVAYDG